MMEEFKIDYAIISNDQNPEYKDLFPNIQKRWNQLGIKTVYLDITTAEDIEYNHFGGVKVDDFGNITFQPKVYKAPKVLCRWFHIMALRFYVATFDRFKDKVMVISDGDLFPINKKYLFKPSYTATMYDWVNVSRGIVTTNHYPNGNALATFTYGLGSTFDELIGVETVRELYDKAAHLAWVHARIYANDEHFINWLYEYQFDQGVAGIPIFKVMNRKWVEMVQEMNNLYEHQIDYLETPFDLCPFIEFHNMRASTMTEERWGKLFSLLEEYDKYPITPNNWYFETVKDPWTDTILTKDGELILSTDKT